MAKASIHIKPRQSIDALLHNERVYTLSYAIDNTSNNHNKYFKSKGYIKSVLSKIKTDYQKHSYRNRRLPSNSTPIKEGVLNLNATTSNSKVELVAQKIAQKLGVELLMVSVHRDEGHIGEDGTKHYNYHAHILLNYYDFKTHKIIHQNSKIFEELQDLVANELQMERGVSKKITKLKHIDTHQFKALAKSKAPEIKLTVSNLKKEIQSLRSKLVKTNKELEEKGKDKIYTQDDYQALNALKRELNKSNLQEIYQEFLNLKNRLEVYRTGIYKVKDFAKQNYNLEVQNQKDLDDFLNHLSNEKQADKGFFNKIFKLKELKQENKELKQELEDLKQENEELKNRPAPKPEVVYQEKIVYKEAPAPKPKIIYQDKIIYQEDTDKIKELERKNDKLKQELEAEKEKRKEAEARAEALKAEVEELTEQANYLLTQLDNLKKSLKEAEKANQNKKKRRGIAP